MSEAGKHKLGRWTLLVVALALCAILLVLLLRAGRTEIPFEDRPIPVRITCVNNMKQIGLAFIMWRDDHGNFPFNVSTNASGTMELCAMDKDGFDTNVAMHLRSMSNELSKPIILICPKDSSKKAADDFRNLESGNVSYRLRTGTNVSEANPRTVLMVCPIDGNILYCDGSVTEAGPNQFR